MNTLYIRILPRKMYRKKGHKRREGRRQIISDWSMEEKVDVTKKQKVSSPESQTTRRTPVRHLDTPEPKPKTEKGYISLGMSKRISQGQGLGYGLLIGGKYISLANLSLFNSKKVILLDIPRDIYPFSVFSSSKMCNTYLSGQGMVRNCCHHLDATYDTQKPRTKERGMRLMKASKYLTTFSNNLKKVLCTCC